MTRQQFAVVFCSFTALMIAACGPLKVEMAQPSASPSATSLPVASNVVINILMPGSIIQQPMPGYPTYPIPGTTTPPTGTVALSLSVQGLDVVASLALDVMPGYLEWKPGMPEQPKPDAQYGWAGGMWMESYSGHPNIYGSAIAGTRNIAFKNVMSVRGFKFNLMVQGAVKVYASLRDEDAVIATPNMGLVKEETTDQYGHKARRLAII